MEGNLIIIPILISLAIIICFFVLCANVSKLVSIEKLKMNSFNEYIIHMKMGDTEKAIYFLKRSYAEDAIKGITDDQIKMYKKEFEKMSLDFSEINKEG